MTDATSDFFDSISQSGAILGNASGTVRVDLDRGKATEHYLLTIDKGTITVSTENVEADATMHTDKALFDKLARGEANAMASVLRGLISSAGDPTLLVRFQRLFPGPSTAHAARTTTTQAAATQEARPA